MMKTFIGVVVYGIGMCGMGYYFGHKIGVARGKTIAYNNVSDDVNEIIDRISDSKTANEEL